MRSFAFILAATVALAGCSAPEESGGDPISGTPRLDGTPTTESFDFEGGMSGWTPNQEFRADPEAPPTDPPEPKVEATTERASGGNTSIRFTMDPNPYGGTVWITRSVRLTGDAAYSVQLTANFSGNAGSGLADGVLYVGTDVPADSFDFSPDEAGSHHMAQRIGLTDAWQPATLEWATPIPSDGVLYIAVGISGVSETPITGFVDDVLVQFNPAPAT